MVSHLTVLRIFTSIGGTAVFHFAIWNDGAGDVPPVRVGDLVFPNIEKVFEGDPPREKDLIMPEPTQFIDRSLPLCSVIRPSLTPNAGAMPAATALTNSNLCKGQSQDFFDTWNSLATAAAMAQRICSQIAR